MNALFTIRWLFPFVLVAVINKNSSRVPFQDSSRQPILQQAGALTT